MKMLFILGCRRSATTALQTQVQAHPSVHYFNGGVLPEGRGRNEFHLFDLVDTAFATAVRWLRVEDVIAQPREQIQAVAAWLGIEPYTRFVPWQPVNRDRWRTDPAFAGFTVHPMTRDIGRRFGYEL